MRRKVDGTPKSRTPVRAVRHDGETRANVPTAKLGPSPAPTRRGPGSCATPATA